MLCQATEIYTAQQYEVKKRIDRKMEMKNKINRKLNKITFKRISTVMEQKE